MKILIAEDRREILDFIIKCITEYRLSSKQKPEAVVVKSHEEALRLLNESSVAVVNTLYIGADIAHIALHKRKIPVIITSKLDSLATHMPDSFNLRFVSRGDFFPLAFRIGLTDILQEIETEHTPVHT